MRRSAIHGFTKNRGGCPFRGANHLTEGFAETFHEFFVSLFRARAFGLLSGGKDQGLTPNVRTG